MIQMNDILKLDRKRKFIKDPTCQLLVLQNYLSGGEKKENIILPQKENIKN